MTLLIKVLVLSEFIKAGLKKTLKWKRKLKRTGIQYLYYIFQNVILRIVDVLLY